MKEKSLYYAKKEFYEIIRKLGGLWDDRKKRPLVCLIKSTENDDLYWAIPMGKYNHRDEDGIKRINEYMDYPEHRIESCYYHMGRTTNRSIFFISDAIPITDKYIDEEHVGADNKHFTIKNITLVDELERKLKRILSIENANKNHYRQRISDVKKYLLEEISIDKAIQEAAVTIEESA